MPLQIPPGHINVLAISEALVDFISLEETGRLRDAYTFRRVLGGAPAPHLRLT